MKEAFKIIGIVVSSLVALFLVIAFGIWFFSDPFNIIPPSTPTPEIKYSYEWKQCFDNDDKGFTQEYADKVADEAELKHPGGEWTMRGRQDILGCTGDLFYLYQVK